MATDFMVRVTRYFENESLTMYDGIYVSKVYAIDIEGSRFLVYDPGEGDTPAGFTWVNFEETMKPISGTEESPRESIVELFEQY